MKNQNKYPFIDKTKNEDRVAVTVKLTWDNDIVVAAQYSENFFQKWSVCLLWTSVATSDFGHPSKDYIIYISTDFLAEMVST